jgi:hypothetical protein
MTRHDTTGLQLSSFRLSVVAAHFGLVPRSTDVSGSQMSMLYRRYLVASEASRLELKTEQLQTDRSRVGQESRYGRSACCV